MTAIVPARTAADDFRAAMRNLASGIALATTLENGMPRGMTITALTSVSAEPPTVLIGINARASCHDAFLQSGIFGVSLLNDAQRGIAMRFAGMTDIAAENRFSGVEWHTRITGAPLLTNALATLDCKIIEHFCIGTHSLFIGKVEAASAVSINATASGPLVNFQGCMQEMRPQGHEP